ncbi:hypothetical protein [Aurantibacillus circumpalustris]|uniref:hypothetical protein n=1 Tax=Aurantibacillus circumpalustris TaxID=3036359 RepID=UPI00295ABB5A|nr:hypothetical protein [Aurantibacillus circumpalustris]
MKRFLLVLSALTTCFLAGAATLVIEGKYQNKNVYVHNGFGVGGVGFCAKEIRVNGNITTDEINSSAFEIDLKALHLKYGENVTIEISHHEGCTPKVLNMEDLKPKPTFEVLTINIAPSGLLKWTSKNEMGALPYVIEQFKWNKWVPVGIVDGLGTPDQHDYSFQVAMHSGENKYRIKQKGLNALTKMSKDVTVASSVNKPTYAISRNNSSIDFSEETAFEIYDAYGVIVKKGFGKQLTIDNLGKGQYYLCYDNVLTEFKK